MFNGKCMIQNPGAKLIGIVMAGFVFYQWLFLLLSNNSESILAHYTSEGIIVFFAPPKRVLGSFPY